MPVGDAIYMVEGDTLPKFDCELEGVNITGYSFVLRVRLEDGTRVTKTGTITDASNGLFNFQFSSGDLPRGEHEFEIEITNATLEVQTLPSRRRIPLRVRADIG